MPLSFVTTRAGPDELTWSPLWEVAVEVVVQTIIPGPVQLVHRHAVRRAVFLHAMGERTRTQQRVEVGEHRGVEIGNRDGKGESDGRHRERLPSPEGGPGNRQAGDTNNGRKWPEGVERKPRDTGDSCFGKGERHRQSGEHDRSPQERPPSVAVSRVQEAGNRPGQQQRRGRDDGQHVTGELRTREAEEEDGKERPACDIQGRRGGQFTGSPPSPGLPDAGDQESRPRSESQHQNRSKEPERLFVSEDRGQKPIEVVADQKHVDELRGPDRRHDIPGERHHAKAHPGQGPSKRHQPRHATRREAPQRETPNRQEDASRSFGEHGQAKCAPERHLPTDAVGRLTRG